MSDNLVQVYTVYISAPASKVWAAITTSEYTTKWGYGGDIEIDLTPGSDYRSLTTEGMKSMGMGDVAVSGTVLAVEPEKRLELTWAPAWHPEGEPTRLVWELTEYDGPLTKLVLTHDVSANPDLAVEVAGGGEPAQGGGGWPWAVAGLKTLLETGRPMVGVA